MHKKLKEIKHILGVTEYTFNQDNILDLSRHMREQDFMGLSTQILFNDELCEVTFDEVLVIFGLMKESKIGIYKNPAPEIYPVEFILISWEDLNDTWAGDFIDTLKRVQMEIPLTKLLQQQTN